MIRGRCAGAAAIRGRRTGAAAIGGRRTGAAAIRGRRTAAGAGAVVLLAIAGCGASAGPRSPQIPQVSITAPTDGAAVVVPDIFVIGTVTPTVSTIAVDGRRVRVRHGAFHTPLHLRKGRNRITIVATEPSRRRSVIHISVRLDHRASASGVGSQVPVPIASAPGHQTLKAPRLGGYPAVTEHAFLRSCVATASASVSPDVADYYCGATLACVERRLSLARFVRVNVNALLGRANPDIHTVVGCAYAVHDRLASS